MEKYARTSKCNLFSAALLALTLGMASCNLNDGKGQAAKESQEMKVESVTWEEKLSAEGCKISASFPTDTTMAVSRNVWEWINEELGGSYDAYLFDGEKPPEHYGTLHAEQFKRAIEELGPNTAMDHCAYYAQFKKVFETCKLVTFTAETYEYAGGAHGGESLEGCVFRKSDGRRFGWEMFTAEGKEKLRDIIKERLKKFYFKTGSDEEFYAMLLDENASYSFPLPETAPICRANGMQFIYQQYEIAPYAAGIPTCTVPYTELKGLFTTTVEPLIESTTDSLAMKYNPTVVQ